MRKTIIVSLLLMLSISGSAIASSKYQIISSTNGNVYRLNKETGEIFVVADQRLLKVKEEIRTKIYIGESFETEEGEVYDYRGKGKFELKPLSSFTDEELLQEISK